MFIFSRYFFSNFCCACFHIATNSFPLVLFLKNDGIAMTETHNSVLVKIFICFSSITRLNKRKRRRWKTNTFVKWKFTDDGHSHFFPTQNEMKIFHRLFHFTFNVPHSVILILRQIFLGERRVLSPE